MENVAKVIFAVCELLVIRGVTKKIVLTRLMVGHTHEDIDARFAVIWSALRLQHVLSPQGYAEAICSAFDQKLPVDVQDIWVVPNYTQYFSGSIDKKFGRYAKKEWTQLQFTFESVEPSVHFPQGVKTTYRKYAADKVIEIERCDEARCGFLEKECIAQTFPAERQETGDSPARPAGMYILNETSKFPEMVPCGFKMGGRAEFDETFKKVQATFKKDVVEKWEEFAKKVPQNDDVNCYLETHPDAMYIPFRDILFRNVSVASINENPTVSSNSAKTAGRKRNTVFATESVLWSNRGDPSDPVTSPTITDPADVNQSNQNSNNEHLVDNETTYVSTSQSVIIGRVKQTRFFVGANEDVKTK